jgi:hypothetical protein
MSIFTIKFVLLYLPLFAVGPIADESTGADLYGG